MAVYTPVGAAELAAFLARFDVGEGVALEPIAEGIENSNYRLITTTSQTFLLTLFERRTALGDLPYFLALTDHLADRGVAAPRTIRDRAGVQVQTLAGRPACLIAFLPGRSPAAPSPAQAAAAGAALAQLHLAARDFAAERANQLGPAGWQALLARDPALFEARVPGVGAAVGEVVVRWPEALPTGTIHADLFPDNVLMEGDAITGLIDFYFACRDTLAYDLAVMHSAWAFAGDDVFQAEVGTALIAGYGGVRALSAAERAALPVLAQGACLRFVLTRAWDWAHTPADALVTRKDPLAYWRRYVAYRDGMAAIG